MSEYICQICDKKYTEEQALDLGNQCHEEGCNGELSVIIDIKETINISAEEIKKKEKEKEEREKLLKKENKRKKTSTPPPMKDILEKERRKRDNKVVNQKITLTDEKESDSIQLIDLTRILKYVLSISFTLFIVFFIYNYFTERHRKQEEIGINIEKINKWGYINTKENPNIRKGVNINSIILASLKQGETIYVFDLDKKTSQYWVKFKNIEGYIHQKYIDFEFVPMKGKYIPNSEFIYGTWNIIGENSKYVFNKDNSGVYLDKKNRKLYFSWSLYGDYNKSLIIDVNENNNRWIWDIKRFEPNKLDLHCDDYNLKRTIKR